MKILNLAYPDKSEIKFKTSRFPDGQQDLFILPYTQQPYGVMDDSVIIHSRFNSFRDLELIICAVKALRRNWPDLSIKLFIPYLLGARSDRQFQQGGTSYLVDVVAPIINSLDFKKVRVYDAHSDVAAACINNLEVISNIETVEEAIMDILDVKKDLPSHYDKIVLISPDAGSLKKVYKVADFIRYKDDIVNCTKDRDAEGKLTKVTVPINFDKHGKKNFIIIDDICDGGATFINIAKEIRDRTATGKIYLIVTHGIFSKGYEELNKYFDGIYCTNSYSDFRAFEDSDVKYCNTLIKHLNIF